MTYRWLDGRVQDIATMSDEDLHAYRAEFLARVMGEKGHVPAEPAWKECEFCGMHVSPQAEVYGMPIHGECWQQIGPKGRATAATRHGLAALAYGE